MSTNNSINNQGVPAGTIIDFGGTTAPQGYLACDGTAVSRTTYAALFAAISTTWGVGDGSTTFNLPASARTVLVGSGGTGTATLGNAVGNTGGSETHVLTDAELSANAIYNTSSLVNHLEANTGAAGYAPASSSASWTKGSGTAHNIMQPSAVVLRCIKT